MKNLLRCILGLWLALGASALASQTPEPLTAKERAQGYREHRIIAKPRADYRDAAAAAESRERMKVRRAFPRLGHLQVIDLDTTESADHAIARLRATGRYEYVERDQVLYARAVPNDPSFSRQWSLRNTAQTGGTSGADISAVAAWDLQNSAANVIVAIIDSGARLTHQDLAANLWTSATGTHGINAIQSAGTSGYNTPEDDSGHGTHVTGIIGAVGNNGLGVSGVAWSVKLMPLKFIDSTGSGSTSDAVECINYAIANGAKVINASYGATGYSSAQYEAIKAARDAGIIFVAAAGNDTADNDLAPDYPSGYLLDNIVSVASTNSSDTLADSSNFGSGSVELAAPGVAILSTYYSSDSSYETLGGTSMAAPHVSGAIALLRAKFPNDTYRQAINRVLRSTTKLSSLSGMVQTGGRLNLAQALASTSNRPFNDDFQNRAVLGGANVRVRSSNADATSESTEPSHGSVSNASSLWWSWTPSESAQVVFDTAGSGFDTVLAVYTGSSLSALQSVGFNDDANGSTTSRLLINATAGTTYQVAVASKAAASGLVVLKVGSVPTNDDFGNARTISGNAVQTTGTTLNASRQSSSEPNPTGNGVGHSVWYRWIAPSTTHYSVAAYATTSDTVVGVYTGSSVDALTTVATNDNNQNAANTDALAGFDTTAGTTYYFQVDHTATSSSTDGGAFTLTVTDSVWEYPTLDEVTSSPAVASDGTIYFGAGSSEKTDNRVYAVTSSGALKWRFATGDPGIIGASPAIGPDGTVYIGSMDKSLYALNGSTGAKRWSYAATSALYAAPAIAADGTVYFRDDDYLYALTSAGALKWQYPINSTGGEGTYCSPVIAPNGTIYVGNTGGKLYALTDGGTSATKKWEFTANSDIFTSPALAADGTLYFGTVASSPTTPGVFYALTPSASGATLKWSFPLPAFTSAIDGQGNGVSSSPALAPDGTIYFAAYDHKLYALNPANGATKWSYPLGDEVRASSPAIAADGTVYIGVYDGFVYAVTADGTLRRKYPTAKTVRSSPVIAGNRLYFGSADAKLHAFDLGQSAATSAWPMFRANPQHTGRPSSEFAFALQPLSQAAGVGSSISLSASATSPQSLTYQWTKNGVALSGATGALLSLANLQPANAGIYRVSATSGTTLLSDPVIVGLTSTTKIIGAGSEVLSDRSVTTSTGTKVYDQILLTDTAVTITANPGQITRTSYIDLNNDIVQVEFSGSGALTLVLEESSGPAAPANYNQPAVSYMKGRASIIITGADETTNVSVFTVGRITAVQQTLFKDDVAYDGIADIAYLAILSRNGRFGGLRTANTTYSATVGLTGVYAPGVQFAGPVYVGDIAASGSAAPVLQLGAASDTQINGGDLLQANNEPVTISGITQLRFVAGTTSHGTPLAAKTNRARLMQNGTDVTSQIAVNPAP